MTDRHRRPFVDVPSAVLGFGLALLAASAAWLACSGVRVDEQGTSFTSFERWALWGGLACGLVLTVTGAWCVGRQSG